MDICFWMKSKETKDFINLIKNGKTEVIAHKLLETWSWKVLKFWNSWHKMSGTALN